MCDMCAEHKGFLSLTHVLCDPSLSLTGMCMCIVIVVYGNSGSSFLTRKRTKERLIAAVAAILLSFLLHSLNVSIAWEEEVYELVK